MGSVDGNQSLRSGSTQQVAVRCFTSAGTPIGTHFTMRYVLGISLDRRTGFLHASGGRKTPVLLRKRLLRFQLSWRRIVIRSKLGLWRVSRGLAQVNALPKLLIEKG